MLCSIFIMLVCLMPTQDDLIYLHDALMSIISLSQAEQEAGLENEEIYSSSRLADALRGANCNTALAYAS